MLEGKYGAELVAYGEKIRKLRESMGMSQNELAEKSGISRAQVARIEKMQMMPSLETITKIGLAMNVTVNYFLVYDKEIIENRRKKDCVDDCETVDIEKIVEVLDLTLKYYKRKAELNEKNSEKSREQKAKLNSARRKVL